MEILSKLFSPSPFPGLSNHASETGACLRRLQLQVEAARSADQDAVAGHLKEIEARVLYAGAIAEEALQLLSRRVLLPVRREDVISTFEAQNRMLCACGEIAALISACWPSWNDETGDQFARYVREVLELATMATDLVAKANVLVEVAFAGPEADKVNSLIDNLRLRKTEANLLRNRLLRTLFAAESDVSPIEHSFCLGILTEMGRLGRLAETLTNRFRLFVCQRSPVHQLHRTTPAGAGRAREKKPERVAARRSVKST